MNNVSKSPFELLSDEIFCPIINFAINNDLKKIPSISSTSKKFHQITDFVLLNFFNPRKTDFLRACETGKEELVKKWIERHSRLIPAPKDKSNALKKICKSHNVNLIKFFLTREENRDLSEKLALLHLYKNVDRSPKEIEKQLELSLKDESYEKVDEGDVDFVQDANFEEKKVSLIKLTCENEECKPSDFTKPFLDGCRFGFLKIVEISKSRMEKSELLINQNDSFFSLGLTSACQHGRKLVVDFLLKDGKIVPSKDALRSACKGEHYEVVDTLLKHPNLFPIYKNELALIKACEDNDLTVVKEYVKNNGRIAKADDLLENWKTDKNSFSNISSLITVGKNFAIVKASARNRKEIVKILLKAKFDPTINSNRALYLAAKRGYFDVVKTLLKSSQFTPNIFDLVILEYLCSKGGFDLIKFSKKHFAEYSEILKMCKCTGQKLDLEKITSLIKNKTQINSLTEILFAIACHDGHYEVINQLLTTKVVQWSTTREKASVVVRNLKKNGYKDILNLLSNYPIFNDIEDLSENDGLNQTTDYEGVTNDLFISQFLLER